MEQSGFIPARKVSHKSGKKMLHSEFAEPVKLSTGDDLDSEQLQNITVGSKAIYHDCYVVIREFVEN